MSFSDDKKRKFISNDDNYVLDGDDDDDDDDRKPAAKPNVTTKSIMPEKRLKGNVHDDDKKVVASSSSIFSIDLVCDTILSFLNIKQLYTISKTSRFLRELIQHKHVVRSALLSGGHAKQSMENIFPSIRARKIYAPSAMRLLRICNGKRCEFCGSNRVNTVFGDYGLFICKDRCIEAFSKPLIRGNNALASILQMIEYPFLDHPRMASTEIASTVFIFKNICTNTVSMERKGPVVTDFHIDVMTDLAKKANLKKSGARIDITKVSIKYKTPDGEVREGLLFDVFWEQSYKLNKNCTHVPEIEATFHPSLREANERSEETHAKKRKATEHAVDRKRQNVLLVVEKLSHAIGETSWKESALDYQVLSAEKSTHPTIQFKNEFVQSLLRELILAPSKANKTKIADIKEKLEKAFKN